MTAPTGENGKGGGRGQGSRSGTLTGWLLRRVWRLYPQRYRERFGAQLEADLERMGRGGRSVGPALVGDALVTLVRTWLRRVGDGGRAVEGLVADLRHAARRVRRSPGYAVVMVGILSLSLGATTSVFSVGYAVLLRTLPYREPERVFRVEPTQQHLTSKGWVPDPDFDALPQVEATALYFDAAGANLTAGDAAERVSLVQVTGDFFGVLGVDLLLGPGFPAHESPPDAAVLSHGLWTRMFGADRGVIGRSLELNGRSYRVVGVAPADATYPTGTDLWLPTPLVYEFYGGALGPEGIARLARDGDAPTVRAILDKRVSDAFADVPDDLYGPPPPVRLTPLERELSGPARAPLTLLLAISSLVVLLGCLNLAGLAVSRTSARAGELRVRRALGARRSRVFLHLLVDALALALAGGLASLVVARLASRLVVSWLPAETPGLDSVGLPAPVLAFAAAGAIFAGLLIGVLPAWQGAAVGTSPSPMGRAPGDDRSAVRLQSTLVTAQVALACVLVVGAGLLGRSLAALAAVPLGYDLERVVTFRVSLPESSYPDPQTQGTYASTVTERLRDVPGVRSVGASSRLPLSEGMGIGLRMWVPGTPEEQAPHVSWVQVSADYFGALGLPVLEGTGLRPETGEGPFQEVALTRSVARSLFGEEPALGKRVNVRALSREEPEVATVAAVVGDLRLRQRESDVSSVMFTSLELGPVPYLGFAVATAGDPTLLVDRIQEVLADADPSVPPFDLVTTAQSARREIAARRALALLSGLYAVAALVLAALGLYGLVAQTVLRRRRELGIRMALGADVGALVAGAVRRAMAPAVLGLAVGLPAATFLGPLVESLLYGVEVGDLRVSAAVAALMTVVAALAAYVPARGAARVDPVESLRAD